MEFKGKKIMVLGGAFQHCKVVESAKELGMTVYVTDYLPNSPAKKMADVALMFDVKNIDGIVDYCKREKIDGVINTSLDPCQIPYQEICEKLNLPCFGTRKQFMYLTNKAEFKKICGKYGVPVINSYSAEDIKRYSETNKCIDFPILIKPADSRGSRGQTVCYDICSARKALCTAKNESATGRVIIEKYMNNYEDFTVAYIFIDGRAFIVRTGDRYVGAEDEGLNKVAIASASPSKYTDLYLKYTNEKVIKMLKGIGIKNGPVFMQGFRDGNDIRFYDPGYRFSGGEYERLFKIATGIDLIKMLVKFAIYGKIEDNEISENSVFLNGRRIMQLCPTITSGKICAVYGKCDILSLKQTVTFSERYKVGESIPECDDVRRRFAEICTLCENQAEEIDTVTKIQEYLSVLNEKGEEMICNKLDLNLLKNV